MRFRIFAVVATVAVTAAPAARASRSQPQHVTLCILKVKPGNAFTFVPPPDPRPQAGGGATINVTYTGFSAAPQAQAAFAYAVSIWAGLVSSPVPIEVSADFTALDPSELGSAGATLYYTDTPNAIPGTFYGDPLADRIAGANQAPGSFDITAQFNSNASWYFGTDGNTPPGQFDFVSVVLHELGHGLGFAGFAFESGGVGEIGAGGVPSIFDLFTVDENGAALFGFPNPSTALGALLTHPFNPLNPTGPGVYWGGAQGVLANGGQPPRLYTPSTWEDGSSYSHFEEDLFPEGNANSLMTYQLAAAEAIHSPGPIVIGMFDDIGWASPPELMTNGNFSSGLTGWMVFEPPDIVHNSAAGGVFEYFKANPTTTPSGQAVVLQNTGVPLGAGDQMLATFQVGNSSSARKRISVLIHDQDFSDLSVCTFWVPAFAGLQTYRMLTHTTEAWAGASISFYAASSGSSGGNYQLDNVSLRAAPAAYGDLTTCFDPWGPLAPGGADGPEMLSNGNFGSGSLAPWQTFGTLTHQLAVGVFEFTRDSSAGPAGVVLQPTGQALPTSTIVTAFFDLGNSSNVRKRVTVLLHDLSFGDLSACTFWLAPGQPMSTYAMRSYVTTDWSNATISVYAASVGTQQWTRLDNVSMMTTPGSPTAGTDCGEPGSSLVNGSAPAPAPPPAAAESPGVWRPLLQAWRN